MIDWKHFLRYQNTVAAEDFTYSDDCEGVYSVAGKWQLTLRYRRSGFSLHIEDQVNDFDFQHADEVDDEYDDIDQMCAKWHILSAKGTVKCIIIVRKTIDSWQCEK